jgi:hypothetical protein
VSARRPTRDEGDVVIDPVVLAAGFMLGFATGGLVIALLWLRMHRGMVRRVTKLHELREADKAQAASEARAAEQRLKSARDAEARSQAALERERNAMVTVRTQLQTANKDKDMSTFEVLRLRGEVDSLKAEVAKLRTPPPPPEPEPEPAPPPKPRRRAAASEATPKPRRRAAASEAAASETAPKPRRRRATAEGETAG